MEGRSGITDHIMYWKPLILIRPSRATSSFVRGRAGKGGEHALYMHVRMERTQCVEGLMFAQLTRGEYLVD